MITGIGSLPFTDVDEAIDLIFSTSPKIPFWPQLPQRSAGENMYTTFLEGVPAVSFDETKGTAYVDTTKTGGIEEFYGHFAAGNLEALAISERAAPGFYRFLERIGEVKNGAQYIKGQLTGPFSMGLGLKDEQGKSIIYNYAFFDIIKKAVQMKARWIISAIKKAVPDKEAIIFFDEPFMVSFGSAYVSVSREEAISLFTEVLEGIEAIRGVHCCGNTDWSVLFNAPFDIVNYDAHVFMDTIFYYPADLIHFVDRGGWLSPGIVPASDEVLSLGYTDILKRMGDFDGQMKKAGAIERGPRLITTSCGLGTLTPETARRAMELLKEVGESVG